MRKLFTLTMILLLGVGKSFAQSPMSIAPKDPKEWPDMPIFKHGDPFTLTNQKIFFRVAGAAAISYALAKWVLKSEEQGDYMQIRNSFAVGEYKNVWKHGIGVERRVAPWFAIALEFNLQHWTDEKPLLKPKYKKGMGIGIQPYFRWNILGRKRLSPYIEYGTGLFQAFQKFPDNGTNFTFTHNSHLGLEYTMKYGGRLRLSYGQYHQSNNDYWDVNPSFNANGFNFTYSWKLMKQ